MAAAAAVLAVRIRQLPRLCLVALAASRDHTRLVAAAQLEQMARRPLLAVLAVQQIQVTAVMAAVAAEPPLRHPLTVETAATVVRAAAVAAAVVSV